MGKYYKHKRTKSGYLICVVPMCQTKKSTTTLKTFEFPSDRKRRSQWISAIVEASEYLHNFPIIFRILSSNCWLIQLLAFLFSHEKWERRVARRFVYSGEQTWVSHHSHVKFNYEQSSAQGRPKKIQALGKVEYKKKKKSIYKIEK